jgi:hypothetical protein
MDQEGTSSDRPRVRICGRFGSADFWHTTGSVGPVWSGFGPADLSGESVSAAGDVNGDGIGDVIIGAFGADPFPSQVFPELTEKAR